MKSIYLFVAIGFLSLYGLQGQKKLSPVSIEFEFVSKGVDGTIGGFQSGSSIDLENFSNSIFKGSVAVKTLKTGNFLRDWSLKGRKYFDEDAYPRIYFEGTEVMLEGDAMKVKGKLTIKGTSRSVAMQFTKKGEQLIGTTSLNASDFGINVIKKRKEDNRVTVKMIFGLE